MQQVLTSPRVAFSRQMHLESPGELRVQRKRNVDIWRKEFGDEPVPQSVLLYHLLSCNESVPAKRSFSSDSVQQTVIAINDTGKILLTITIEAGSQG